MLRSPTRARSGARPKMPSGRTISTDDHQHVGHEILGAAADIGVEIAGRQVLDDADDQPADHRADDRIEPAQDHHRKHLEADQRQLVVDAEHRRPRRCRPRPRRPRPSPRRARNSARTLIPIAIATCWLSATARIATPMRLFRKNQVKPARKTRLTAGADQLHRRQPDRPEQDRVVADRQRDRPGAGAEHQRRRSRAAPRRGRSSP